MRSQDKQMADAFIYFIIDTTCVNAFVAFGMQNPNWNNYRGSNRLDKRRLFLLELGETLFTDVMKTVRCQAVHK